MAFNVYLNGKWIDTVYFYNGINREQVRRALINKDGYDPAIRVTRKLAKMAA